MQWLGPTLSRSDGWPPQGGTPLRSAIRTRDGIGLRWALRRRDCGASVSIKRNSTVSGILNEAHKARLLGPVDIQLAYQDYTNHFGLGIGKVKEALLHS